MIWILFVSDCFMFSLQGMVIFPLYIDAISIVMFIPCWKRMWPFISLLLMWDPPYHIYTMMNFQRGPPYHFNLCEIWRDVIENVMRQILGGKSSKSMTQIWLTVVQLSARKCDSPRSSKMEKESDSHRERWITRSFKMEKRSRQKKWHHCVSPCYFTQNRVYNEETTKIIQLVTRSQPDRQHTFFYNIGLQSICHATPITSEQLWRQHPKSVFATTIPS